MCQMISLIGHVVSAHRSILAAAIDGTAHLGITLNGDARFTTHQGRVAVGLDALTGTEYVTEDVGCTSWRCSISDTNYHSGVILHTGNLTTAIDVSGSSLQFIIHDGSYFTVTNNDKRITL